MFQPGAKNNVREVLIQLWSELKLFSEFFSKFCEKSNIHGIKFIFSRQLHPVERLLWLGLFMLACYGAYSISSQQYQRYVANPTVISLERDYRDWNGTLPAISVCYHKRVDEGRAQYLIKRLWSVEKEDAEYEYFLDYVKAVVNVNESYSKFNRFANDKRLEYISMITIAKEVHPIINSVISSFDTNAEFTMNEIITEKGICYSVNSILSPLISTVYVAAKERNFLFFISFVVYSTMNQKKLSMQSKPLSCFFVKNQCYMKLDVYDPTVFVKSRLTRLKFS